MLRDFLRKQNIPGVPIAALIGLLLIPYWVGVYELLSSLIRWINN